MSGRGIHAALRVAFAILGLAAIAYQMLDLAGKGTLDPVNFFSYFTIQSNLIGIAALLWAATAGQARQPSARLVPRRGNHLPGHHLRRVRPAAG